jgi:hypothetical protein
MILLPKEIQKMFIDVGNDKGVYLEGNIIKMMVDTDEEFKQYLNTSLEKDSENRKKRLELTKQLQTKNSELEQKQVENDQLMDDLKDALEEAENAKQDALKDLNILQQKTQFELIGNIVKVALLVILCVGIIVTMMYVFAMSTESTETTLIGNTWSNLFGILLTNSFSIIGTIMGVKYADSREPKSNEK